MCTYVPCISIFAQHTFLCQVAMHNLGKTNCTKQLPIPRHLDLPKWEYISTTLRMSHVHNLCLCTYLFWTRCKRHVKTPCNKYCKDCTFKTFGICEFHANIVARWGVLIDLNSFHRMNFFMGFPLLRKANTFSHSEVRGAIPKFQGEVYEKRAPGYLVYITGGLKTTQLYSGIIS